MDTLHTRDTTDAQLAGLYRELNAEMHGRILPFWMKRSFDPESGGFFGRILSDGSIVPDSPRGSVLNARILWTFSAVYNQTGRTEYLDIARSTFVYFTEHFVDPEFGGLYWSVDAEGNRLDGHKQIYAQAFGIYALSEYYIATGERDAILLASDLFGYIEKYASDPVWSGYVEALSREWKPIADQRLSDKDANEPKSMNTHLHVLEAYTRLYDVWKDEELRNRLHRLVEIHRNQILQEQGWHFNLFFDMGWAPKSEHYSFGHDIEGAWLLTNAARALANAEIIEKTESLAVKMARVTLLEGIAPDGSLYNEGLDGRVTDTDRHWWPQAEAMIGFFNAWEISGNPEYLTAVLETWQFVKMHFLHPSGEWWWLINENYETDLSLDLAGEWKCPYHNTRCCLEIISRVRQYFGNHQNQELINALDDKN
jgi:cellobiose epimerase